MIQPDYSRNPFGTPYKPIVIPGLDPAYLLRGQERYAGVLERDINRAYRLAQTGWEQKDVVHICWHEDPRKRNDIALECVKLLQYWRSTGAAVSVDVETTRDPPTRNRLKSIGLSAAGTNVAVAFPTGNELLPLTKQMLMTEVRAILGDPNIQIIGHNYLTFDAVVLERYGCPTRGVVWDTLVLAHVLDPDIEHTLGFVAQDLLDVDPWKHRFDNMEKAETATMHDLLYYNGRDAIQPQRFLQPILSELADNELLYAAEKQTAWTDIARQMEMVGVWIDQAKLAELHTYCTTRRDTLLQQIADEVGWPELTTFETDRHGKRSYFINKPSVKQELLYKRLKLPVQKYTPKNRDPSTSTKAVLDYLSNPVVRWYVEWAEVRDDLSRTIEGFGKRLDLDGRLRPSWNTCGQVGTRFTSKPNIQNIPDRMRSLVAAPPGRILVAADMAQLEYRISAAFAGAKKLLEAFREGVDAHMLTTRAVFGRRCDRVDAEKLAKLRYICKRVTYGMNYGAGAATIAAAIKEDKRTPMDIRAEITVDGVAEVVKGIFRTYPEIPRWRNFILDFANTHGYLIIPPLGRKRIFASTPVEATKAYNWPIQTSAGDIFNLALLELRERLPEGAWITMHGHDAVTVECNEGDAESIGNAMEECFEYKLDGPAGSVRLYAKAHAARTYADLH